VKFQQGLGFDEADVAVMENLADRWSADAKMDQSLDTVVAKWQSFVVETESGYKLTIYDYTNDLSARNLIEELMGALSESGRSRLAALVAPIDKRFRKASRRVSKPLLASPRRNWWWWRVPRVLIGPLAQDLREEDFD
jgi:hypothetical protein